MKQVFKKLLILFIALITSLVIAAFAMIFLAMYMLFPKYTGLRLKYLPPERVEQIISNYFENPQGVSYEYEILDEYGPVALAYPKANVYIIHRDSKNNILEWGVGEFDIDDPDADMFNYFTEEQIKNETGVREGDIPYLRHIQKLMKVRFPQLYGF